MPTRSSSCKNLVYVDFLRYIACYENRKKKRPLKTYTKCNGPMSAEGGNQVTVSLSVPAAARSLYHVITVSFGVIYLALGLLLDPEPKLPLP